MFVISTCIINILSLSNLMSSSTVSRITHFWDKIPKLAEVRFYFLCETFLCPVVFRCLNLCGHCGYLDVGVLSTWLICQSGNNKQEE